MGLARISGPPGPRFDIAVMCLNRCRARRGPRPSAAPVAEPEPPEVGIGGEAVVAVGSDPGESADRLATEPESVLQTILRTGELDQVDAAHARRVQRDAIRELLRAGSDDQ